MRFICLTTLLLQPELPSLILLDEPELGLHPHAIALLVEMLYSAATQTQLIVATQSVGLIDQIDPDDVIIVDRTKKGSTFRHLSYDALEVWLKDYSLGELWAKNVFGGGFYVM